MDQNKGAYSKILVCFTLLAELQQRMLPVLAGKSYGVISKMTHTQQQLIDLFFIVSAQSSS